MQVTGGDTDVTTYFSLRKTSDGTAAPGLTITGFDLQYTRSGAVPSAKVDATALAATNSAHADNKAIEIDATDQPGLYRVDWPDAAFAAGVREVVLTVKVATAFTEHLAVPIDAPVDVTKISGDSGAADNVEADYDGTGYDKADSTIGTCTVNTDMVGTNGAALASVCTEARLAELAAANLPTDVANVKAETALIVADTNELQTDDVPGLIAAQNNLSAADVNAEVDSALNTAIPGSPTADSMNERVGAMDTLVASLSTICTTTRLAQLDASNIPADVDAVLADTAALDGRLTAARAGYLDNLNVSGNVASSAEVMAIQNNTRTTIAVPGFMERPDAGSTRFKFYLNNYDTAGNMEEPDSAPTVAVTNEEGTDRSGNLQHPTTHGAQTTMVQVEAGRYWIEYDLDNADAMEGLVFTFSVVEGGATRKFDRVSLVVDTTAVDFTDADRTRLVALDDLTKAGGDGDLAAMLVDTGTTIPGRLPAALVGGRMDCDATAISGDAVAADRLESMLDGTGGNTLSLGQLSIVASGNDDAIVALGAGTGSGVKAQGGSGGGGAHGMRLIAVGAGHGLSTFGGVTGDGIHAADGATSGDGIEAVGGGSGSAIKGNLDGSIGSLAAQAKADVNVACDVALTDYDGVVPADLPANFADLDITASTGMVTIGDIVAAAIAKLFTTASGETYATSVEQSLVQEIADNAGGGGGGETQLRSGTAQAGAAGTITLDAGASAEDNFYRHAKLALTGGTGAGQGQIIDSYVGSTKVATMAASWATAPDNTTTFVILPLGTIPGASAPTAAQVADAVHDEARADHTSAGSFGELQRWLAAGAVNFKKVINKDTGQVEVYAEDQTTLLYTEQTDQGATADEVEVKHV